VYFFQMITRSFFPIWKIKGNALSYEVSAVYPYRLNGNMTAET